MKAMAVKVIKSRLLAKADEACVAARKARDERAAMREQVRKLNQAEWDRRVRLFIRRNKNAVTFKGTYNGCSEVVFTLTNEAQLQLREIEKELEAKLPARLPDNFATIYVAAFSTSYREFCFHVPEGDAPKFRRMALMIDDAAVGEDASGIAEAIESL